MRLTNTAIGQMCLACAADQQRAAGALDAEGIEPRLRLQTEDAPRKQRDPRVEPVALEFDGIFNGRLMTWVQIVGMCSSSLTGGATGRRSSVLRAAPFPEERNVSE
jgi:hypothetical protein